MPSTVANKLNHNLLLTPKTANAFHMNSASTTKFKSIVTLEINIRANWPSLHKGLTTLSMDNNSQSMVLFSYSDH
jgi:hypothetical protein